MTYTIQGLEGWLASGTEMRTVLPVDKVKLVSQLIEVMRMNEELKRLALWPVDEEMQSEIEESGFWHSCSGCHETFEGRSCGEYPTHPLFKCEVGSGCRECGGLGVLWDDTDYEDFAAFSQETALSNPKDQSND